VGEERKQNNERTTQGESGGKCSRAGATLKGFLVGKRGRVMVRVGKKKKRGVYERGNALGGVWKTSNSRTIFKNGEEDSLGTWYKNTERIAANKELRQGVMKAFSRAKVLYRNRVVIFEKKLGNSHRGR